MPRQLYFYRTKVLLYHGESGHGDRRPLHQLRPPGQGTALRNLADFLVHLFSRVGDLDHVYLSTVHERCLLCEEPISESQTYLTYRVCPFCRFHYTLSARRRIELLADKGTFKESHKYLSSVAPLSFSGRSSYRKLLSQDQNRT